MYKIQHKLEHAKRLLTTRKGLGSVPEVFVEGVLEVVGEAKLSLGPLKSLGKSKTKEVRQRQNTHCGARTHDHKVKGLALYRLS